MHLGVNVDHVATLRNLRDTVYPDVVDVAKAALESGADFITVHLREDRRHIKDRDLYALKGAIDAPINLEMAATDEMKRIALDLRPESVCLVPEKREEKTTELGIDAIALSDILEPLIDDMHASGIRVTLFLEPVAPQIECAKKIKSDNVELHVGRYCLERTDFLLEQIANAARLCYELGLECHAGHGIDFSSAKAIANIKHISAINVGHFIMCDAIMHGIRATVSNMKSIISRPLS